MKRKGQDDDKDHVGIYFCFHSLSNYLLQSRERGYKKQLGTNYQRIFYIMHARPYIFQEFKAYMCRACKLQAVILKVVPHHLI